MPDGERKSSEDLIRDANWRFRTSQDEEPETRIETPKSDPVAETPHEPEPLRYRSTESTDTDEHFPTVPPSKRSRVGSSVIITVVRWGLAFLVFGGWFLFTRLDDANRDDTGQIVSSGDLDVMTMQVGDCFNDRDGEEDVVVDVAAVPCAEPHDNEVFAVMSLGTAFPSDSFPGQDALWAYTYEVCSGSTFDTYVGTRYLDSSLEVFSFTPTQESWDEGDREFVCALFRLDLGQLTGTARGSGS